MIFVCDTESKIKQPRFLLSRITCAFVLGSSMVSNSLRPHGLYSPWNSPGQNTGVGSHVLLQGFFPSQGLNPGLLHCRQILLPSEPPGTLSMGLPKKEYWSGLSFPAPGDLPDSEIEHASPALAGGVNGKVNPLVWPLMYRYY